MTIITLEPIPNQSLTLQQDGHFWGVTIKSVQDMMYASISVDNVPVVNGARCVAGALIIPSQYQESAGNFAIATNEGDNPDYAQFGNTQFLIYYSPAELEAARG